MAEGERLALVVERDNTETKVVEVGTDIIFPGNSHKPIGAISRFLKKIGITIPTVTVHLLGAICYVGMVLNHIEDIAIFVGSHILQWNSAQ